MKWKSNNFVCQRPNLQHCWRLVPRRWGSQLQGAQQTWSQSSRVWKIWSNINEVYEFLTQKMGLVRKGWTGNSRRMLRGWIKVQLHKRQRSEGSSVWFRNSLHKLNQMQAIVHTVFQTRMGVEKLWNQSMNDDVTTITCIFWEPSNTTGPFYSVNDLLKPSFRRVDASDIRKHVSTRIRRAWTEVWCWICIVDGRSNICDY